MGDTYQQAAERLLSDHDEGRRFENFSSSLGIANVDDAYAVQARYVELLRTRHGDKAGYKVGATSKRIQEWVGIGEPIGGVMLRDRVMQSGAEVPVGNYGRAGVEFEIGVRMGRDVTAGNLPATVDELADAVEAVCPAFEIIDDRDAEYGDVDILSILADNSWNAGAVLGAFSTKWPDLAAIRGVAELNGAVVDEGHGRDVLGHPFEPLLWLARHLTASGSGLRAGDIVLTGSMVPTRFAQAGDRFDFSLDGLGSVSLAFSA